MLSVRFGSNHNAGTSLVESHWDPREFLCPLFPCTSGVSQFKVHEYRLVVFWSLVLGSPDSGGREDGLSAIGAAADLMTSPHQLFLLLSLLQLFTENYILQSNKQNIVK